MGIDQPKATSTPTSLYPVRGRKGIREDNSVQSPIDGPDELSNKYEYYTRARSQELSPNRSPRRSPRVSPMLHAGSRSPKYQRRERLPEYGENYTGPSQSDSEPSQSESDEPIEEQPQISSHRRVEHTYGDVCDSQSSRKTGSTKWFIGMAVVAVALAFAVLFAFPHILKADNNVSIPKNPELAEVFAKIEKEFSKQEEDFWRNIRVSIKEVTVLDQPRSIIFLYDSKARRTMEQILKQVSKAALCHLKDCSHQPVEIQGSHLNSSEIINDYGKIISMYRGPLEENGVLILKHLEQVPGNSAQALHHFCDDYHPVVRKALLLFTLEVDKLPDSYPMTFVEKFLLNLWKDMGVDDKFYPLFTRISGTILRVQSE